jgi:hypothetical protein
VRVRKSRARAQHNADDGGRRSASLKLGSGAINTARSTAAADRGSVSELLLVPVTMAMYLVGTKEKQYWTPGASD